jgi:hypothetical protein
MQLDEYDGLKVKFLKVVASVPLPLREEIIAVIDGQTVNWDVAHAEIKNDGKKAKLLLEHFKKMGII